MREAGPRLSWLAPNAQMWPSAKGASFFRGLGASSPKKFIFFILENVICAMKQQITLGLGKTKGNISER